MTENLRELGPENPGLFLAGSKRRKQFDFVKGADAVKKEKIKSAFTCP
jgi:hypothetical protein